MTAAAKSKTTRVDVAALLQHTTLFANLDHAHITDLVSQTSIKTCPKNYMLFAHEEDAQWFYLVAEGWVKLFRETLDGNEAVIDIFTDGHVFGETSLFGNGRYSSSAQVIEDATLLVLPLSALRQLIEREPKVALNMLDSMTRFRQQQERELEHRSLQNAPQRIGCFLLRLCKPEQETDVTLHLPYDKTLIAARLGMKPETFSRALARLREETGIAVSGASVHISNIARLTEYTCSACSDVFPCQDLSEC